MKMNYQLVKYQTPLERFNKYSVVPSLYLSNLLNWLKLSESARIVSVTDNYYNPYLSKISQLSVPAAWPSCVDCAEYVRTSG